jgi:hypothetical protein
MTTVAQLIAHLQTLPQEAIVRCLSVSESFWETSAEWIDLHIDDDINVVPALKGKVFVEIGSK